MKLLYITNARIPTEKAHGLQIVKMCEAFQRQGVDVELFLPTRLQSEAMKDVSNIWQHYEVATPFPLRYVATPDFLCLEPILPKKMIGSLYYAQCFLFSIAALLLTWSVPKGLYYSRSLQTIFLLCLTKWIHRKPIYFEAHELHGDPARKGTGRKVLSLVMRWMLRHIDGLIVISHGLKDLYLAMGMDEQAVWIAPDGIDEARLSFSVDKSEARRRLNISAEKRIVCYTGHLFRWKGVYVLAESVNYLPENCLVYIVGGMDSDLRSLRQWIAGQHLTDVVVPGYVPYCEVATYLAAADVLVLPNTSKARISREYTSPLKLFEYMGARRPIVASDLPSLREILRHEENAYLVQPDDPKALADGISSILGNKELSERIQESAYHEVREYTWDKRAVQIERFLRALRDEA